MAKITFSDENQAGDIPTFEMKKEEILGEYASVLSNLIYTREGKVVVCFHTWIDTPYDAEHTGFFIGEVDEDIEDYTAKLIENISDDCIRLNFFCFDTYEDAFKYCTDLKEGL